MYVGVFVCMHEYMHVCTNEFSMHVQFACLVICSYVCLRVCLFVRVYV